MKKLLALLLACFMCTAAFAETAAPEPLELMPYIGNITWKELRPLIPDPFFTGNGDPSGIMMTLGENLASCVNVMYADEDAEIPYGWDPTIVFFFSISKSGYSLNGISVGDRISDIEAICMADGWTKMDVIPDLLDGAYEKTTEGVQYTLGYIIEYGTDQVSYVSVKARKLDE